jgi:hypothetical protein
MERSEIRPLFPLVEKERTISLFFVYMDAPIKTL